MLDGFRIVWKYPSPFVLAFLIGALIGTVTGIFVADRAGDDRRAAVTVKTTVEVVDATPGIATPPLETSAGSTTAETGAPGEVPALRAALERGVAAAEALGGTAGAAVWLPGWADPVVVDHFGAPVRLWSIAKPVVALAAYQEASDRQVALSPDFDVAMEAALVRSEDCPARRMALEVRALVDEDPTAALRAFQGVLAPAGVHASTDQITTADSACHAYLRQHRGALRDPLAAVPLFGTTEWTIEGAVSFARTLGSGAYGPSGDNVLAMLRRPKAISTERWQPFTADASWGAGKVFPRAWQPAYKAGWGGYNRRNFLVGQIVVLDVGSRRVALAVYFRPTTQPPRDDPGITAAPGAVETVFRALMPLLHQLDTGG